MSGSVSWFVRNPAVANLMMVMLLVAGVLAMSTVRQETLPNVPLERIGITVAMPQASPALVERLLCAPIEQAIFAIEGLAELTSEAHEGVCMLRVDVQQGYQTRQVLEQVRMAVDALNTLPDDASRPVIQELVVRNRVMRLLLVGALSDLQLYQLAHQVRTDLLAADHITIVDVESLPAREVALEVARQDLHRYRMTLGEMAAEIHQRAQPVTAGVLRSDQGDMLLAAGGRMASGQDYLRLPLRDDGNGDVLYVGDIATLHDGFERVLIGAWHDNRPAVALDIYRVGSQQVLQVAASVYQYLDRVQLPAEVSLLIWEDDAAEFQERTSVLWSSALQALLILGIILSLFLGLHLAGWIALGIPVAMLGAMALFPVLGESINTISLFAFLLVLGIVVDDAIIVGESIHQQQRLGYKGAEAAIRGAQRVARPVFFAVLTTALAFSPLLFLPGPEGALMRVVPLVALAVLALSLVESLWILPAHLAGAGRRPGKLVSASARLSESFNQRIDVWLSRFYRPLMKRLLHARATVISGFIALFMLCIALLHSGWVQMVLFSHVEGSTVVAEMIFPRGTPSARITEEAMMLQTSARDAARSLQGRYEIDLIEQVLVEQGLSDKVSNAADPDTAMRLRVTLMLAAARDVSAAEMATRWRQQHGHVADALSQRFDASLLQTKPDIHIHLYHPDLSQLDVMAAELELALREYAGVHEISNSLHARRPQVEMTLTDAGRHAGVAVQELGRQVRHAFHGIEVDRVADLDMEVPVILRLAESDSESLWHLQQLPIFLADGSWAPLGVLAHLHIDDAPALVGRYERRRHAALTALVDNRVTSPAAVMASLEQGYLVTLAQRWPGADWGIAGKPKAINEFLEYIGTGYLLALMAIFFVLTVLFGNYSQPLLVMSAVPFGLVGATLGHFALGIEITLWSMVGTIAVSGVVVNDNLVLLDEINRRRDLGEPLYQAVIDAGASRFRPILLTTMTTVLGVMPLILADTVQARFLVPMAVSLAGGVLFATLVSLVLIPCLLVSVEEMRYRLRRRRPHAADDEPNVDGAYAEGREAALSARNDNPYGDEVLHAAWEAGYQDARGERAA
jgi:multidrug efflux pump subunit AcrB